MSAARVAMTLERRRADSLLTWRLVAKDGANRSPAASAEVPARLFVAVGETYDVEVTPRAEGDEELRMLFGLNPEGVRIGPVVQLAAWRIRVLPASRSQH